ncbi:MAG TPA: hypothetical protein VFV65_06865 [Gemmatimonadales bacterium]|nr:hypothetical protein [Gemmatimonadales bacterium]
MGGGCYGTFYARQLERARARGALQYARVLVVDRDPACQLTRDLPPSPERELVVQDWDEFFDGYLDGQLAAEAAARQTVPPFPPHPLSPSPYNGEGGRPSYIVPSPLMPHLMFNWLMRRARRRFPGREVSQPPLTEPVGTPYDTLAPDGTRYVSWADWLCPTHCVEPATCPVIKAPRTWEMSETAEAVVARLSADRAVAGPALFVTRHLTDGVGAFAVSDAVHAAALLDLAGASGRPTSLLVGTVSGCHGALGLLGIT